MTQPPVDSQEPAPPTQPQGEGETGLPGVPPVGQEMAAGPMPVPSRVPVMIPPYAADAGSKYGLRMVQTDNVSQWNGVPTGDAAVDQNTDIAGLVSAVYDSVRYDTGGGQNPDMFPQGARGKRVSVSELQPGDIVAWQGGWRGTQYIGHLAVYGGDGDIIEAVGRQPPARRKLHKNENVFGIQVET